MNLFAKNFVAYSSQVASWRHDVVRDEWSNLLQFLETLQSLDYFRCRVWDKEKITTTKIACGEVENIIGAPV